MPGKVFNKDVVSGLIQTTKLLHGLAIIDKRKKIGPLFMIFNFMQPDSRFRTEVFHFNKQLKSNF